MYEFPTLIVFADPTRDFTNQFNTTIAEIGVKMRGRLRFVLSGVESEIELKIAETLGLQINQATVSEALPVLVLFDFPLGQDLRIFRF